MNITKIGIDIGGSSTKVAASYNGNLVQISFDSKIGIGMGDIKIDPLLDTGDMHFVLDDGTVILKEDAILKNNCMIQNIAPESLKHQQQAFKYNLLYALLILQERHNFPIDNVKIVFTLPPKEAYAGASQVLRQQLKGEYKIQLPYKDNKEVVIKLDETSVAGVIPEGVASKANINKADISKVSGNALVVDIGRRSTEIVVLRQGRAIEKSAVTIDHGTHNLESNILTILRNSNIVTSENNILDIMTTGKCRGIDVTKILDIAYKMFSNTIYNDILQAMSYIPEIPFADITAIIAVGRIFSIGEFSAELSNLLSGKDLVLPMNLEYSNALGALSAINK